MKQRLLGACDGLLGLLHRSSASGGGGGVLRPVAALRCRAACRARCYYMATFISHLSFVQYCIHSGRRSPLRPDQ
jgi:uncharacterized membrane protein YeiH